MFTQLISLVIANLRGILRDRVLYTAVGVSLVMFFLVPALSRFSMRQTQELAVTISLSTVSFTLLIITLLLGVTSLWRDIERGYAHSVLSLPFDRGVYLLAKSISISIFLCLVGLVLCCAAGGVIYLSSIGLSSEVPLAWGTVMLAVAGDVVKCILLAQVALFFSTLSTSFVLPFFGTFAIYLVGSASQEVYEYVNSVSAASLPDSLRLLVKILYYFLPNFSAFNFKVQAIYALSVSSIDVFATLVYALVASGVLLSAASWLFRRREFP